MKLTHEDAQILTRWGSVHGSDTRKRLYAEAKEQLRARAEELMQKAEKETHRKRAAPTIDALIAIGARDPASKLIRSYGGDTLSQVPSHNTADCVVALELLLRRTQEAKRAKVIVDIQGYEDAHFPGNKPYWLRYTYGDGSVEKINLRRQDAEKILTAWRAGIEFGDRRGLDRKDVS